MNDLTLSFSVAQSPDVVYAAIKHMRGWWSETIDGASEAVGDEFTYRHEAMHVSRQRLDDAVPNKRLVWRVTEADLTFVEPRDEWKGTQLVFEIARTRDGTEVTFTHVGLTPACACFDACRKGWKFYVDTSLRALIVTGRGQPDRTAR